MKTYARCSVRAVFVVAFAVLMTRGAAATETVVRNDSMTDASSVTPCLCLVKGDIPAAWLTSPISGHIVGVQIFWKSQTGGAPDTFEDFIRIYDGSSFPTPGSVLQNESGDDAVVVGPITLSDSVLNEFRFLDQAQTVPMRVPVSAGETFAVGLQIVNQSSGGDTFTPSLTYDSDGCQSGTNGVFVIDSDAWIDACSAGVTGDWVIRAIIKPSPIPAVTTWGLVTLAMMLLAAGAILQRRRPWLRGYSD